jgi:hypothetical protein
MCDGRKHQTGNGDHRQAAVKRIDPGEQLAASSFRIVQWPHSSQQHRRIEEGIKPVQVLEPVVADHSGQQRHGYQCQPD